jgi:ribosomal protein S18 acetylase RimI-like enzyme
LLAGSVYPANAFYLGLYGGSQSPGVLESDRETLGLFQDLGYEEIRCHSVLQRQLAGFRPIVDRKQMQLRRQYRVEPEYDPPARSWWEACTFGQTERMRHRLISRRDASSCGSVIFWDMERMSTSWGVHAMGLMDLNIVPELRGRGLATFLVGEALRHAQNSGTSLMEVQVQEQKRAGIGLFEKLGFQRVDRGHVLRRTI